MSAVAVVQSDVDADGAIDTVKLVPPAPDPSGVDGSAWVRVEFANGGIADGQNTTWDFQTLASGHGLRAVELHYNPIDQVQEVLFATRANTFENQPTGKTYVTMILQGCSWVPPTTVPILHSTTTTGGFQAWGCVSDEIYAVEIETVRSFDFNGTWTSNRWRLDGLVWSKPRPEQSHAGTAPNPAPC